MLIVKCCILVKWKPDLRYLEMACCDLWGCKESDTTERLNWTALSKTWVLRLWDIFVKLQCDNSKFASFKVELMFSIWFQSWLNYPPCLERKRATMELTDGDRYLKYNTQTEPLNHSFHFVYVGSTAVLSEGVLPENHSLAPLHLPGVPWNQSKLNLTSGSCRTGFSVQPFIFSQKGFWCFWKFSLCTQDSLPNKEADATSSLRL